MAKTTSNTKISIGEKEKLGLVKRFQFNQTEEVKSTLNDLEELNIKQIKIDICWYDWYRNDGKKWFDYLFNTLGGKVNILPCIIYNSAPVEPPLKSTTLTKDPQAFAYFVDMIITNYGEHFEYIQLWDEPNHPLKQGISTDYNWNLFCEIVGAAANWCRMRGKKTVLGGMNPIDPAWLQLMFNKGLMNYIDVVGINAFPNVSENHWRGWDHETKSIRDVLKNNQSTLPIWITETGYSTWQLDEKNQVSEFINAMNADADKIFWNGLKDITTSTQNNTIPDVRNLHFGMKHENGSPKLLYTLLSKEKNTARLINYDWMTKPVPKNQLHNKYTLITGGAGFVGVNLADRLLSQGKSVMVFDNLSRDGVYKNLLWLKDKYAGKLLIMVADVRNKSQIKKAVENAEQIFHFAAQVAVTSSLENPFYDFEVNARGTLNLLEAVRNSQHQPPVIFTSTNKVYGDLNNIGIVMNGSRYHPENLHFRKHGISEERNLEFHSPYGCTKGLADQYILDYTRTFGLKTVVFRMSCIYGPHQFGTEDQGWVAHFLIQALKEKPITIYGDGKQVRDILFIDDLLNAFEDAAKNIDAISGNAFNIGGGVNNTTSLLELIEVINSITNRKQEVIFNEWRPSDQKYYVSDYSKFQHATGWQPRYGILNGVKELYNWLKINSEINKQQIDTETNLPITTINFEPIEK